MEDLVKKVSDNLDQARVLIEEALNIGREHGIPVDLARTGVGASEDLWYVTPQEYREEMESEYTYGQPDGYELTEEEKADLDERIKRIEENGGYDDNGYKVTGWLSSSTNC